MSDSATYQRALKRLMYELYQAICEDRAYAAMWNCHTSHGNDLFRFAFFALSNDTIAHAMKILDVHRKSASFWYIDKQKKQEIREFCDSNSISFAEIKWLSGKLQYVRNRTHFHIDPRNLFDPTAVWKQARINNSRFTAVLESLWKILDHFYTQEYGLSFGELDYDGSEVGAILRAVRDAGIVPIQFADEN